jgi:hypothetical protein
MLKDRFFVLKLWLTTIIIAPFLGGLIDYFFGYYRLSLIDIIEIYPIFLLFSFPFSVPTLILCYLVYFSYVKLNINHIIIKVFLILFSILGIIISFLYIGDTLTMPLILSYTITVIIAGFFLSIKRNP